MIYEVDQSGKVENTSKDTIICIACSYDHYGLVARSNDKRRIQKLFRSIQHSRHYTIFTFSALIAIALSRFPRQAILIDNEYDGHFADITRTIRAMTDYRPIQISFGWVGKKSYAHNIAYSVGKKMVRPNYIATYEDVVLMLKKTEFEKRFKNA